MMKKIWMILALSILGSCLIISAREKQKKTPLFKVNTVINTGKNTFRPGEKIPLKITCTYPSATHQTGSWGLFAYLPDTPEGFEKTPGSKVKRSRDPRWSSVELRQGYWFQSKLRKNKEQFVSIDTAGFPEGDYRMNIRITFQPTAKGAKYIYRAGAFTFTIEK